MSVFWTSSRPNAMKAAILFENNKAPPALVGRLQSLLERMGNCEAVLAARSEIPPDIPSVRKWDELGPAEAFSIILHVGEGNGPFYVTEVDGRLEMFFYNTFPGDEEFLEAVENRVWTLPDDLREWLDRFVNAVNPSKGNVWFVPADVEFGRLELRQWVCMISQRFRYVGNLTLVVPEPKLDVYRSLFGKEYPVITLQDAIKTGRCKRLVVPEASWLKVRIPTGPHLEYAMRNRVPVYRINFHCDMEQLRIVSLAKEEAELAPVYESLYPHAHQNFINFVLHSDALKTGGLHPGYGVLDASMRGNARGPVNSLGYRISYDYDRFVGRSKDHAVIALFGGSSAEGDRCFHDDTISVQLERKLREHLDRSIPGKRVTVLNFGWSSRLIDEEISAYNRYCHRLRPDIVISHTGWNDCWSGMACDINIVARYGLLYNADVFFNLHEIDHLAEVPLLPPDLVVGLIIARLKQFRDSVTHQEGTFVIGLQPAAHGKQLSEEEEEACYRHLRLHASHLRHPKRHDHLPFIYNKLRQRLTKWAREEPGAMRWLDCQGLVGKTARESNIFCDIAHLTPLGNRLVAEAYFELLKDLLFADGSSEHQTGTRR